MRFTRITLLFIAAIITLGFFQLAGLFLSDVEPQTFQATEEMMVDTANLLAEIAEDALHDGPAGQARLLEAFQDARRRRPAARIFEHLKQEVGLDAYITDRSGRVIFDSQDGRRTGLDYSRMRDVALTLAGHYGARSSRDDESDATTSVLYVAAPIGDPAAPAGVLTVHKPQLDMMPLVRERRRTIQTACALIGAGILFLIGAVFLWLFRPIGRITEYARAVERGERPPKPKTGIGREVNTLARALDSMRDALEDRRYVERYVRTLTHELKSPLAGIRGAAELLDETMPEETRRRFLGNILAETARSERLINRLLELSAIESRKSLEATAPVDLRDTVARALDQARPTAELARVTVDAVIPDTVPAVNGDAFMLRAAVTNLLENAIDFSPPGASVEVRLETVANHLHLTVTDHGPGIPEYARDRVFERFFSLKHHTAGRKGTGLGLTLVRETAELHGGSITIACPPAGGTVATLILPAA